jgi:hypothetical protein
MDGPSYAAGATYRCECTPLIITIRGQAFAAADPLTQIWSLTFSSLGRARGVAALMSDLTAMVLMVAVTLMALSIIWGTYVDNTSSKPRKRTRFGDFITPWIEAWKLTRVG